MTAKDQEIEAIRQKMESARDSILSLPNVVGIGVGLKHVRGKATNEIAIVVLVRSKAAKVNDADRIPSEIDGVKTDVIEVGEMVAQANSMKIRPALGGVSICNAGAPGPGTYGCLLRTETEPNLYILSNNHVIARSNMGSVGNAVLQTGDPILQPAPADGGSLLDEVGKLSRFPFLVDHQIVDCAIARTNATTPNNPVNRAAQLDGFSEARQIPGSFGSNNQGGGIAVFDISGNGQPDLVVFHIDHAGGGNRGFYRIGFGLDNDGTVTGQWTEPTPIPGWFGTENQGGGIAIADISGSGRPDLIVFHIDHPGAGNAGYYRIGWDLDTAGVVTGGWTDPILVPGWFGSENQGGGIAVADISASGQLDLIVFHIDHPAGGNNGYYRIGRDLSLDGKVTHQWLGPFQIPGWFGHETQGAGIAVADIDGDGVPELVVCHVDNPTSTGYPPMGADENAMYYRVGPTLPGAGVVVNWSAPRAVAGWIGTETQAASVALADFTGDSKPDFLAFHIDNPSGENRGFYRVSRLLYPAQLRWAESLNGTAPAKLGERVWKSGRTTEITNSTVVAVSVSYAVNFSGIGYLNCHDQIMMQPSFMQPGDSGSIVVNSERQVIGLGFASGGYGTLANRIENVFQALRFGDPRGVPGWFGTENQGGGIAVADVAQFGTNDLIVFHIDHPGGGNTGFYRVGVNLDANGTVRGFWTAPFQVPGPFGNENHGGDITVGDIDHDGRPDLIVFHIDSPGGGNRGFYRIGWNLNRLGAVEDGWTAPILIPGWFGTQNHGGGIAVADIGNDGRLDLIVFHIDSPGGGNKGYFRIGRALDATGVVTGGWTEPIEVPGWFGTLSQGAGIAAADLRQAGKTDLIVYHVDHTGGGNDAYYRIGWDVNSDGVAAGGWTGPIRIPGWFGTETQGGGIAVANLNNNNFLELITLNIDHPSGGNAAFHRVIYDIMPSGQPALWSVATK